MKGKIISWGIIIIVVFLVVTKPQETAGIVGDIARGIYGALQGIGNFISGLRK